MEKVLERLNYRGVGKGGLERWEGKEEEAATSFRAVGVLTCESLGARSEVNLISHC